MGKGDPEGQKCDWCPEPATKSFEIMQRIKGKAGAVMGSGQFWYACDEHHDQGERFTEQPKQAMRRR